MTAIAHRVSAVQRWAWIDPGHCDPVWDMYCEAFTDIDRQAAQRHLMTRAEFGHVMTDERVGKYLAYADDQVVGQAVITNDLAAWPLISPRYFETHWPELYAARRIFYIGYVCTSPDAPNHTFHDLIAEMSGPVFAADGMAVMDFCAVNTDALHLPRHVGILLDHLNPAADPKRIDRQEFWAWRFDGQPWAS
jgi:hypothetical protein